MQMYDAASKTIDLADGDVMNNIRRRHKTPQDTVMVGDGVLAVVKKTVKSANRMGEAGNNSRGASG